LEADGLVAPGLHVTGEGKLFFSFLNLCLRGFTISGTFIYITRFLLLVPPFRSCPSQ
jgi:hypothetical protein